MRPGPRKPLDLNLLSVLVALADAGSVSAAALALGLGQSSVSGALARLRAHFDDPLFVRAPGGMAPTPRGAAAAAAARDILREVDERLQPEAHFDPAACSRPATIALSDVGEMVFLPRLMAALRAAAPAMPLRSVSLTPGALAHAMAEGDVDLAVGFFPDFRSHDFFQQRLMTHRFVCLLRAGHPVQGPRLTLGEFLSLEHAVVRSEGRSQELFEAFLEARGIARRVRLETPHFLSLPLLIAQSDMVVTVPHAIGVRYGKPEHGLKVVQPPFETPPIDLKQHWHRKVHKDARTAWLRARVSDLFNEANDEW